MLCCSGKASAGPCAATVDGGVDDDRKSSVGLSWEACQEPQTADLFPVETAFLPLRGQSGLMRLTWGGVGDAHSSLAPPHCEVHVVGAKQGAGVGGLKARLWGKRFDRTLSTVGRHPNSVSEKSQMCMLKMTLAVVCKADSRGREEESRGHLGA